VVLGKVRAKQDQHGATREDRTMVMPLLISGDAAFAGQGVIAECFGLSDLRGHRTDCGADALSRAEAARLGLAHIDAPFESRGAPHKDRILRLAGIFQEIEEPALIHCKSGADRTGLAAGIWLLLHKTAFGRVVRAGVQKPDMVAVLGIKLQPYMTAVVMLGVATAALGGVLFGPIAVVHPAMGTEIMTVAFVVVVIGGLGSFWGVVLAALLVGVVRGITIHFQPAAGEASMYVLMFLVLMFRPRGLLGERIERFE
jgi:hypothetical protein